jgi:hypothetical protein
MSYNYVAPRKAWHFNIIYIYIYGPMFGNAESRLFLFAVQCFNIESMQKFSCVTLVCKQFASYQDYSNYKLDIIR